MRCGDLPRGCQACASERSPELTDLENLRLSYLPTLFREGRTESVDLIGTRRLNRNKYFSILVFRPGSDKAFVTTAIANSHHDH